MKSVIGIDLGGTTIKGGLIENGVIIHQISKDTRATEGGKITIDVLKSVISELIKPSVTAIGIGVPSVVDRKKGIVYNIQNIKNSNEVHLREIIEEEFGLPVFIDNDANCFAISEKYFGAAKNYGLTVGITLGTGVGGGIVYNGELLSDANCGSGEFGELPYLDSTLEEYCGSRFFINKKNTTGYDAYQKALSGDQYSLAVFTEYGQHIASLIKMIVLTVDPQAIVFGGSIATSMPLFENSMRKELKNFPYPKSIENLSIHVSTLEDSGILGAAALCLQNDL